MTAEIAIMNKSGVALAADSKVTIGAGIKAFDTVTKIFPLSRIYPVGLMVWGNPDFMEIPIEVICKEYRAQKKTASEQTILKWAENFVSYLKTFAEHDDEFRSRNISNILTSWFGEIRKEAVREARLREIPTTSPEFVGIFSQKIEGKTQKFMQEGDFVADSQIEAFLLKYWDTLKNCVDECAGHYKDEELTKRAVLFAMTALCKEAWSPASMGFVIAGYGSAELFPALVEFESDGFVGEKLKIKQRKTFAVSRKSRGLIQPFAQSEMVHRFMQGADPDLLTFSDTLFRSSIIESCLAVLDEFGEAKHKTDAVKSAITDAMSKSADEAAKIRANFCWANFSAPIVNMVMMLPKDELPHLAESLVALTSLKRHVSHDAETVGGPIDVALLSKGDGFIWIKRKHYFSAELNPQFTVKYLRSIMGGEDEKPTVRRPRRKAREDGV